jgi:multicomponent Na+:H+ antiporter subunit D
MNALLLPLALVTPLLTATAIFLLGEHSRTLRNVICMVGALCSVLWVGLILWGVYHEQTYELHYQLLPNVPLFFQADAFAMLFAALSAVLWLVTTVYAIGYLGKDENGARFFGFFGLCVAATKGIALSGNLITFFIFYEFLTLATYPLVVHRGTRAAIAGGVTYLKYTLAGGTLLLLGILWLYSLTGVQAFVAGGSVAGLGEAVQPELIAIFFLLVAGFGVKAALVPLHGWLPQAMVAPAPVSALLHAVAVVKAGAFGIVRVVYDVFGVSFAHSLGVTDWLAAVAAVTIIYGSLRALSQDDLKKRLAYSTVSQVSYIVLGTAIAGPVATLGGIVHLVHQGLMKITLFFCAGNLAETLGVHKVSQMDGCGRKLPWTMLAFTVGALGMIGLPPIAGFVSKWYLGVGGVKAGAYWIVLVLIGSTLLNAAYFLPLLYRAWFVPAVDAATAVAADAKLSLLLPPLLTAGLAVAAGLLAGAPFSPLEWTRLIVEREYR